MTDFSGWIMDWRVMLGVIVILGILALRRRRPSPTTGAAQTSSSASPPTTPTTPSPIAAWQIPPTLTLAIGVIVTLAVTVLAIGVLQRYGLLNPASGVTAAVVVIGYVGFLGINSLPVGDVGVPLLFGKRVRWFLLSEGDGWLPPFPFMDVQGVNVQERTTDLPKSRVSTIGPAPTTPAPGTTSGLTAASAEQAVVELEVEGKIQWKIFDPQLSLSIGEEVIKEGLVNLALSVLREKGAIRTDIDFLREKDKLSNEISQGVDGTSKSRWGVDTLSVPLGHAVIADEELRKAYQKLRIEEREREAEMVERNHIITSIKKISDELGISTTDAAIIFANERKKMDRRELRVTGGEIGDLARAAAMVNDGLSGGKPPGQERG